MLGLKGKGGLETRQPAPEGRSRVASGSGKAVDQVEAEIVKARRADSENRVAALTGAMTAAEEGEDGVVEGLAAEGEAIDAERAQRSEGPRREVAGVELDRDFRVVGDDELSSHRVQDHLQVRRPQNGRCSAAQVNGVDPGEGLAVEGHFRPQALQEVRDEGKIRPGVEAAVRAFTAAKGDVEIKTGQVFRVHGSGDPGEGLAGWDRDIRRDPPLQSVSDLRTARKALWGIDTFPIIFIRFLPFFCFSNNLRLREMSPP
jgi:hypothetical protein